MDIGFLSGDSPSIRDCQKQSFLNFWINFLIGSSLRSISGYINSPSRIDTLNLIDLSKDEDLNIVKRDIVIMIERYPSMKDFFLRMRTYIAKHRLTREEIGTSCLRFWKTVVRLANYDSRQVDPTFEISLDADTFQLDALEDRIEEIALVRAFDIVTFYNKFAKRIAKSGVVSPAIFNQHFPLIPQ